MRSKHIQISILQEHISGHKSPHFQDAVVTVGPPDPGLGGPWQLKVHLGPFLLVCQHTPGHDLFSLVL